jgi:hypothetical protein
MATKYVRKTGSDANNGTNATTDAVLTIARAIAVSTTGDTIDIGTGTWAENINSSRTYLGVSMYKTIISAVTSSWSALTITLQNIRVNHTSFTGFANCTLTYTDAWQDLSAATGAVTNMYATCNMNFSRSIVTASATQAASNSVITSTTGKTVLIDHCVFFNAYTSSAGTDLFSQSTGSITITNTIISISTKNASQPVAFSGITFNYSVIYSALSTVSGFPSGTGNLNDIDPLFKDAAGFDFRLADNSPCIGTGHA